MCVVDASGFINIALSDQMNLLQSTWLDILCFNLAYRSTPYKGQLVFADDFKCSEDQASRYGSHCEVDAMARRLARKLTELGTTREEYTLMKAMLLVNPGSLSCTLLYPINHDSG